MKVQKITDLIKILLSQNDFITIQYLSEKLTVSKRTIHNYLSSQEFQSLIYPTTLIKTPNKGIKIEADELWKTKILSRLKTTIHLNYDKENDFSAIMMTLLSSNNEVALESLADELYLSPSSLTTVINEIDTYVTRFHCQIQHKRRKGILLVGSESHIRKLFSSFMTTFVDSQTIVPSQHRLTSKTKYILSIILDEKEIEKLMLIITISEDIINTNYCDEDYNQLLITMAIIIIRIRIGAFITTDTFVDIKSSQEYYYAMLLKNYLEKDFTIPINENETEYLALVLLGTRKQVNVSNTSQDIMVLEKFLNLLSIRLNVELSNDYELKKNLINHLKPAIHRMKHGIVSENPLLEQIRIKYTEIYMAVITTIEDLEIMESIYFDSNEMGYICLHIIAAVNRPSNIKKIKVALICNEGLSIEIFLKNIIESYFSEIGIQDIFRKSSIHQMKPENFDLIINSSHQTFHAKNVISIDTNFTHKDHRNLKHFISAHTTRDQLKLEDLYNNYLLFFHDTVMSQQELIKKYCDFLEKHHYVKKEFYNSVISRTKTSSTYIARGIALPHGAKDEVLSSVILMINLQVPIKWDDEDTNLVILVAANDDNNSNNYNLLFRKIMKIASSDAYATLLKTCQNKIDLKEVLETIP